MTAEALKKYAHESYDEALSLLKELCSIPAPSGNELKRAEFCRDWLVRNGAVGVYIDDAYNCVCPINTEAQNSLNNLMASVNAEIKFCITGERPSTCTHDCSTCGGCSH